MNHQSVWMGAVLLMASVGASAGYLTCNGQLVSNKTSTCPDGSLPKYVPDTLTPQPAPVQPAQPVYPTYPTYPTYPPTPTPPVASVQRDVSGFMGVWRTNVPGAVWASPTGYQGSSWMYPTVGMALGDLIIRPDGTYAWMWTSKKTGRWEMQPPNAPYPMVLIDEEENRRWHIGWGNAYMGQQLYITDGGPRIHNGRR